MSNTLTPSCYRCRPACTLYSTWKDYLSVTYVDHIQGQLPARSFLLNPSFPMTDPIMRKSDGQSESQADGQIWAFLFAEVVPLNSLSELHWHVFTDATQWAAKVFSSFSHSSTQLNQVGCHFPLTHSLIFFFFLCTTDLYISEL